MPTFDNVAFFIVRDDWLDEVLHYVVVALTPHLLILMEEVNRLKYLPVSQLQQARNDYMVQERISHQFLDQMAACAI